MLLFTLNSYEDFNKINEILASLVDDVQQKLAHIWPVLKLLDYVGGRADETLINFNMKRARDQAWKLALDLAPLVRPTRYPRLLIWIKISW